MKPIKTNLNKFQNSKQNKHPLLKKNDCITVHSLEVLFKMICLCLKLVFKHLVLDNPLMKLMFHLKWFVGNQNYRIRLSESLHALHVQLLARSLRIGMLNVVSSCRGDNHSWAITNQPRNNHTPNVVSSCLGDNHLSLIHI